MKNRVDDMYESLRAQIEENFLLICEEIQKIYSNEYQKIWMEIASKLTELFLATVTLQQNKKKGEIKYIYIQYLHSSLNTGKWGYRIEVFDEKFYLSKEEICVYYYPEFLYQLWEKDLMLWNQKLRPMYPRIQEYEMEKIKTEYIEYYNLICRTLFKELAILILNLSAWKQVKREKKVTILFGGYMEKGIIIHSNEIDM